MWIPKRYFENVLAVGRLESIAAIILVVVILLLSLQSSIASDASGVQKPSQLASPFAVPSDSPPSERDCQHALFAREALLKDETLAPFNVGVSVRNGVATIWGTVPSPALAHRAEERIRLVPGLAQVRNDLKISTGDEEWAEFLKGPPSLPNPPIQEAKRWDHPAPLVSRGEESRLNLNKAAPPLLMPPIQVSAGLTRPVSTIETVQSLKTTAPPTLAEAVDSLRMKNERFQRVRFEVQGGEVHLWSSSNAGGDVFGMAQAVAHIRGVDRVIVERNR
jgi:hypothetical protein